MGFQSAPFQWAIRTKGKVPRVGIVLRVHPRRSTLVQPNRSVTEIGNACGLSKKDRYVLFPQFPSNCHCSTSTKPNLHLRKQERLKFEPQATRSFEFQSKSLKSERYCTLFSFSSRLSPHQQQVRESHARRQENTGTHSRAKTAPRLHVLQFSVFVCILASLPI